MIEGMFGVYCARMVSYSDVEEESFFDSRDEVSSISDLGSSFSENLLSPEPENCAKGFEVWTKKLDSVNERRDKFMEWMRLSSDWQVTFADEEVDVWHKGMERDADRITDIREAQMLPSHSFQSLHPYADDVLEGNIDEVLTCRIKNLDNGAEFVVNKLTDDCTVTTFREVGSNKMLSFDEFQRTLGSSGLVQHFLKKDCTDYSMVDSKKKVNNGWLRKLHEMTHIADRVKRAFDMPNEIASRTGSSTQSVHVNLRSKRSKELTSLYNGQEFPAHEGSILTMKFSPDGQHLASAGEDGIVRVWKVVENDTENNFHIQDADPSCFYFSLDCYSDLAPSNLGNEQINQMKRPKKSSDSACVIIPQKAFQLTEKPVHEFHGHEGEVLALSWSKDGHLLSSSVDKTVRLWRLGNNHCLGIYLHNNYVTCVEFNPVDDKFFISGSIDGKLRIWEIQGFRVIDWTDVREIITAVCYSPDGKGGIVGSMHGNCRFYDVVDNHLELGAQICLKGRKNLAGKRITAFQFCPSDASKVMVTSADSRIQILSGTNIIAKFKGNRGSVSQAPASFTSDGDHIVSSTENSNVHIWSYNAPNEKSSRPKNLWSRESFLSRNTSIAIPWNGLKNKLGAFGVFLDSVYRGSATWPEEKLPESRPLTTKPSMCRSEFKFLKNALLNALNSPHLWGLVIVTAGWDGCIRTFLNHGLPIRF